MRYSSSILDRVEKCPASIVLPQVREPGGSNAEFGTVVHQYLEDCLRHGEEKALSSVPTEHKEFCRAIPLEQMPLGPGNRPEVSFVYDPAADEARELPAGYDRDAYSEQQDLIYGTADVIRVSGGEGFVADYKTGKGNKLQLRFLALCLSRTYMLKKVSVATIYIKRDAVYTEIEELDAYELDKTRDRIRAMQAAVSYAAGEAVAGNISVNAGEHCKYCPAFRGCPAQTALVSMLAGIEESAANFQVLNPDHAGKSWMRVKQIKYALGKIEDALTRYAYVENGFPLPGGGKLCIAEREVEQVEDAITAMQVLQEFDESIAASAVTYHTTKSALKTAADALRKSGAITAKSRAEAERFLLEEVRKRGAMTVKKSRFLKEVSDE
jgi:hypothetical protein